MNIKTLVTPEWWWLAPLPLVFVLLAIEMVFRMGGCRAAERGPRAGRGGRGVMRGARVSGWVSRRVADAGRLDACCCSSACRWRLTFIAINIVGAWLYMGGEVGLAPARALAA